MILCFRYRFNYEYLFSFKLCNCYKTKELLSKINKWNALGILIEKIVVIFHKTQRKTSEKVNHINDNNLFLRTTLSLISNCKGLFHLFTIATQLTR